MPRKLFLLVFALGLIAPSCLFGKPKRKSYNNSAEQVFDAALRTARERHVVTYVDEKHLMFTFETGKSALSYGFVANASVEPESESKSALLVNVQHKNTEGADVSVDGSFVGNAPASLKLSPGKHTIQVGQAGYKGWSRELTVMSGAETKLNAVLSK